METLYRVAQQRLSLSTSRVSASIPCRSCGATRIEDFDSLSENSLGIFSSIRSKKARLSKKKKFTTSKDFARCQQVFPREKINASPESYLDFASIEYNKRNSLHRSNFKSFLYRVEVKRKE